MRLWALRKRWGSLLALWLLAAATQAQTFEAPYARAYRLALKLKVDSARRLTTAPAAGPDAEAQRLLVQSMADFVECMVREDDDPPPGLDEAMAARLDALADLPDRSPWPAYALAEAYLHRGLVLARYGHEVKAAYLLTKAYTRTKDVRRRWPAFRPARKSMGIYKMVLGLAPPLKDNWMLKMLGLRGDVDGGLADLQAAADSTNAQQPEATLLYSMAQMYVRRQPEQGRALLLRYVNNEPDDLAGLALLATVYQQGQQHGRAQAALRYMRPAPGHLPFYYPLLLEGDLHLQALHTDSAIVPLERYLAVCSRKRLVKQLHYKLFVAYYLQGDSATANAHFYAIATDGEVGTDQDRYALHFHKRGIVPDKRLLRARLLYDGGFDERAQRTLDSVLPHQLRTVSELAELQYRRARLAQRRKDTSAAERLFLLTISTAGADPSYYAPNACLQLGRIAYARKQWEAARGWFARVRTYPDHEYKQGLDEQAQAWLGRVARAERLARKQARRGSPAAG